MSETKKTLSDVKPGDEVGVYRYGKITGMTTVKRTTKTQIVTAAGRYRRKNGRAVGYAGDWGAPSIGFPCDEDRESIRKGELQRKVYYLSRGPLVGDWSLEALEAVVRLMEKADEEARK